jgi:hypothetical protein
VAESTGPILAAGGIVLGSRIVTGDDDTAEMLRIALSTGIAAVGLSLLEQGSPALARGIGMLSLMTVLFVPLGKKPTPVEIILRWYEEKK